MYKRMEHQEILEQLRRIEEKLDGMQRQGAEKAAASAVPERKEKDASDEKPPLPQDHTVWNLTQLQYELSNELFSGVKTLQAMIREGEKQLCSARGKYRK